MIRTGAIIILAPCGLCIFFNALSESASSAAEPNNPAIEVIADSNEQVTDTVAVVPKPSETRTLILAEMAEKHGYRLEPEQALCRIAPPFAELRGTYYKVAHAFQARAIPTPPDAMIFFWNGEQPKQWGMSFGSGYKLTDVIDCALKIKHPDIEGPAEILNKRLQGDWVMRQDVPEGKMLEALETILQKQFNLRVHLYFAKRVRPVYVVRGKYQYIPTQKENESATNSETSNRIDQIDVYEEELTHSGGGGSGDFKEFLSWVGRWIDMSLIDDLSDPPTQQLSWTLHKSEKNNIRESYDPELVLKNISTQTGLTFQKELRAVRRLLIEPVEEQQSPE